ncbi:hypothetical protein N7474_007237 [Penicillium riverlandense]|uniref:uncharacterized protein n=1 Tax=Penicillium riverlandense TaxID=1903569 RepID=UPI002546F84E|nr:uncharacterized protein N7474_007237 [Penicillium riverlandense]KAJ5815460.1 hypothetical protein N7474_007237 [Penicillium riverlandense]
MEDTYGSFDGSVYTFNLSTSFNTSSNFSNVLNLMSIAGGAGSNIDPTYIDGAMFANDDEFYLYGGAAIPASDDEKLPDDAVLGYEAYQYGATIQDWEPMWWTEDLPDNVTTYITNGAGASAPSENLGFYFSGMHAPDWGSFTYPPYLANTTADTLITVNMSVMRSETWNNDTLPSYIKGRANAEIVWVPVSEAGVLVAIGGVVDPAGLFESLNSSQEALNKDLSPIFMETVSVYDVNTKTWYLQKTTGDTPPQLTEFCSVLASAADGSSHNIYIYGGYNGLNANSNPYDDAYILSLPSFTWIKVYNGTNTHGRTGHRCIKVYPDQMLAIGGYRIDSTHCLEGGVMVNFNLNNLSFQDAYDPLQWGDYKVPDLLSAQIGGNSSGGATTTAPSSWTNSSLEGIFNTKYTKTIATYWPYNTASSGSTTKHHQGFPTWAAAVIGVLCGLLVVGLIIAAYWIFRRHRQRRQLEKDEVVQEPLTSMYGAGRIAHMAGPHSTSTGQEISTGAQTMQTSIERSVSPYSVESGGGIVHEMHDIGGRVHEMHDSSPIELPTQFNVSSSNSNRTSVFSMARGSSISPNLPQTPVSDSGQYFRPSHHRSLSTQSIDNVVTGRMPDFHASSDGGNGQHQRHGSEISEESSSSNGKGPICGNETIHEHEKIDTVE